MEATVKVKGSSSEPAIDDGVECISPRIVYSAASWPKNNKAAGENWRAANLYKGRENECISSP